MKIYKLSQDVIEEPNSFEQYLEWEDPYSIHEDVLRQLISKFNLSGKDLGFIAKLIENGKTYWFAKDTKDRSYYKVDISEWIYNMNEDDMMSTLGITEDDLYVSDIGPLGDIRANPGTVYHYTNESALEQIQEDKVLKGSGGTGINNRSAYGIFVSVDPEEYATGTYGNILLSIDLEKFKQESGVEKLNIDIEPEYKEYLLRNSLAHRLEIDLEFEHPSDISQNTLIIGHGIPIKYIQISSI